MLAYSSMDLDFVLPGLGVAWLVVGLLLLASHLRGRRVSGRAAGLALTLAAVLGPLGAMASGMVPQGAGLDSLGASIARGALWAVLGSCAGGVLALWLTWLVHGSCPDRRPSQL